MRVDGHTEGQTLIALDVGDSRIGVAGADGLGLTAQGLPTIERRKLPEDLDRIIGILAERGATKLVVGLPKNMNGSIGPQSEKTYAFVGALSQRMADRGIEAPDVVYWDERLTTVAANRILRETKLSRKKKKGAADQVAAILILQGYLDRQAIDKPKEIKVEWTREE